MYGVSQRPAVVRPDGAASLTCPHWRVGVRRPCQQLTPRGTFAWRAGGSRRGGVPRSLDLGLPRPCWAQHFRSKQREDRSSGHRAPGRPPLAAGSAGAGTRPQPAPEPRTASAFVSGKWPSLSLPPTRPVSTPSAPAASLLLCDPPGGGPRPVAHAHSCPGPCWAPAALASCARRTREAPFVPWSFLCVQCAFVMQKRLPAGRHAERPGVTGTARGRTTRAVMGAVVSGPPTSQACAWPCARGWGGHCGGSEPPASDCQSGPDAMRVSG